MSIHKSVFLATIFAAGVIFSLSCISGFVCVFVDFSDSLLDLISVLILCAASFSSGWFSTQLKRTKGLLQGFLCGSVLFLGIFIISFAAGKFEFRDMTIVKGAVCLVFGILGGVTGVNTKKTKLRHKD